MSRNVLLNHRINRTLNEDRTRQDDNNKGLYKIIENVITEKIIISSILGKHRSYDRRAKLLLLKSTAEHR